jgi:hypothetical protein
MRKLQLVLGPAVFLCCAACFAQSFPKPGPEHEKFKKMEGTWDMVLTLPGNAKIKGTMTCKMECGGLWLTRDTESKFGKMTTQVKALDGYDPVKKKYVSVQFDSMSTMPMVLEGEMDEQTNTLTMTGEARNFDGSPEKVKSVRKFIDDDHHLAEVYRIYPSGKETKQLTIEYTRQKDSK